MQALCTRDIARHVSQLDLIREDVCGLRIERFRTLKAAPVSDVRRLDLAPRRLRTQFGALFLFLPWLAQLPFDQLLKEAGLPGTPPIPAGAAMRSLLVLKLFGNARHSPS